MFKIATIHPIGLREFSTHAEAVAVAVAWGFGSWRVYLNLRHPGRVAHRVPSAV